MNAVFTRTPVPSTLFGRVRNGLAAAYGLNKDPKRLDIDFKLGEAVNQRAFTRVLARFERDPSGARVLAEEPAIDSAHIDVAALERLPEGTLGREYARFLRDNGLTLDVFQRPTGAGIDPRAAYLAQRLRQTHDIWHVVTGYQADVPGEVLLQAFTFAQLRGPERTGHRAHRLAADLLPARPCVPRARARGGAPGAAGEGAGADVLGGALGGAGGEPPRALRLPRGVVREARSC